MGPQPCLLNSSCPDKSIRSVKSRFGKAALHIETLCKTGMIIQIAGKFGSLFFCQADVQTCANRSRGACAKAHSKRED